MTLTDQTQRLRLTWESAAKRHVNAIFGASVVMPSGTDNNSAIRIHLDNMITAYFGVEDAKPTVSEWQTLGHLSVVASGILNEDDTATTLCNKQRDYGPNNIARFGQSGLLLRLHDKVARLENLISHGRDAHNESLNDTYLDIVGYSAIGLMLLDGSFFYPLSAFD